MPSFEHFNIDPDGARITDRKRHMIADIYFKPEGIFCVHSSDSSLKDPLAIFLIASVRGFAISGSVRLISKIAVIFAH